MYINYKVGIHDGSEYEELSFESAAPVSVGHCISFEPGGDEFEVTDIVHYEQHETILHCKPVGS